MLTAVRTVTGVLLVVLPVAYDAAFAGLGRMFDFPDVLRRPTEEVLARFRAGGTRLVLLWWAFAMCAVLFVPGSVLLVSPWGRRTRRCARRSCCSPHPDDALARRRHCVLRAVRDQRFWERRLVA